MTLGRWCWQLRPTVSLLSPSNYNILMLSSIIQLVSPFYWLLWAVWITFLRSVYKLVRFYEPSSRDEYSTTRDTLTVFSKFSPWLGSWKVSNFCLAIVAFLLLFGEKIFIVDFLASSWFFFTIATFVVGLRCFSDFDRGLLPSKSHGQSYKPVSTKLDVFNGNGSSRNKRKAEILTQRWFCRKHEPAAILLYSGCGYGPQNIYRVI